MPDDHASLDIHVPSLAHLTEEELGQLRTKVSSSAREARRKSNLIIQRHASLKKPFMRSLSVHKDTPPDERAATMADFEHELLRVPEAFIAHAYANALVTLESLVRDEILKRVIPGSKKKKPPEPVAPLVDGEAALAAMFNDAEGEV